MDDGFRLDWHLICFRNLKGVLKIWMMNFPLIIYILLSYHIRRIWFGEVRELPGILEQELHMGLPTPQKYGAFTNLKRHQSFGFSSTPHSLFRE